MSTVKFFFFFFTQKKDAEIQRLHRVEPQDVFVTPLWFKFLKIVADFFFLFSFTWMREFFTTLDIDSDTDYQRQTLYIVR